MYSSLKIDRGESWEAREKKRQKYLKGSAILFKLIILIYR